MKKTLLCIIVLLVAFSLVMFCMEKAFACDKNDEDSPCQQEKIYTYPAEEDDSLSEVMQCQGKYKWATGKMSSCLTCHQVVGGMWFLKDADPRGVEEWPSYLEARIEGGKVVPVYTLSTINDSTLHEIYNFMARYPYHKKIIVDLQTGGGSIFDAQRVVAYIERMKSNGVTVQTEVNGIAASAGFYIFLSGSDGYRLIHPFAQLMFHEMWSFTFWAIETPSSTEEKARIYRYIQDTMNAYISERSGVSIEELEERIENREFWLNGKDAVAAKYADGFVKRGEAK